MERFSKDWDNFEVTCGRCVLSFFDSFYKKNHYEVLSWKYNILSIPRNIGTLKRLNTVYVS